MNVSCRDIGTMDAYSYLQIKGRNKDMIIRGGENIYPVEIEQFLHKHPKVQEAQVSGYLYFMSSIIININQYISCFCIWAKVKKKKNFLMGSGGGGGGFPYG